MTIDTIPAKGNAGRVESPGEFYIDQDEADELLAEADAELDLADEAPESENDDQPTDGSAAQQLIGLAKDTGVQLFHSDDVAYATVTVPNGGDDHDTHPETHPVSSRGFRLWLSRLCWKRTKKVPSAATIEDAIGNLSGLALFDNGESPVFVRVGTIPNGIVLDLCDHKGRAVVITADGWTVTNNPPCRFLRRRGMLPLPVPTTDGELDDLKPLINCDADSDTWLLLVSWLVGSLHPTGPYPVLAVNGEQGSAKTSACRMLRRIIDPNKADLRRTPRETRDLMIAACNSRVVAFDNLSHVSPDLSDNLCCLSTGAGFSTRELYTNSEEALFEGARPIILNGISEVATRPDLLDRCLTVTLPVIPDERRQPEKRLWEEYERVRPGVLGALLDAVATALRNRPNVRLDRRPRMADFAEWVVAAEPALPWQAGTFMVAYENIREEQSTMAIESSAIGPAVVGLMDDRNEWTGMAKELLAELGSERRSDTMTRQRDDWPRTPKGMRSALTRLSPVLRMNGIEVAFGQRDSRGSNLTIRKRAA